MSSVVFSVYLAVMIAGASIAAKRKPKNQEVVLGFTCDGWIDGTDGWGATTKCGWVGKQKDKTLKS